MKKIIIVQLIAIIFSCSTGNVVKDQATQVQSNIISIKKVTEGSHLFFSIDSKWTLVITKNDDRFNHYLFCFQKNEFGKEVYPMYSEKSNSIIEEAFDANKYSKVPIDLNSSFFANGYEYSSGNPTHFYFQDENGEKYGDSHLTVIIKPNPVDIDIYNLLLSELLNFVSNEDCTSLDSTSDSAPEGN